MGFCDCVVNGPIVDTVSSWQYIMTTLQALILRSLRQLVSGTSSGLTHDSQICGDLTDLQRVWRQQLMVCVSHRYRENSPAARVQRHRATPAGDELTACWTSISHREIGAKKHWRLLIPVARMQHLLMRRRLGDVVHKPDEWAFSLDTGYRLSLTLGSNALCVVTWCVMIHRVGYKRGVARGLYWGPTSHYWWQPSFTRFKKQPWYLGQLGCHYYCSRYTQRARYEVDLLTVSL